jgi:hypothetical protein
MKALMTISTASIFALSWNDIFFGKFQNLAIEEVTSCKTEFDSLTNRIVYVEVDKGAENEGGQSALMRQYAKITLDSIPDDFDTKFIIAFIVEVNGQIHGERVIKDKTGTLGQQMIRIVKSFKWTPAECNGQKVPVLVKLPLQICLE